MQSLILVIKVHIWLDHFIRDLSVKELKHGMNLKRINSNTHTKCCYFPFLNPAEFLRKYKKPFDLPGN